MNIVLTKQKNKSISLSENTNFESVYMVLYVVQTCKTEKKRNNKKLTYKYDIF